jgi:hypothetical protein
MVKKILITVLVLSAILFSGYNYFQSSSNKHAQFLLQQALFPDFTSRAQELKLSVRPLQIRLQEQAFYLTLATDKMESEARNHLLTKAQEIVKAWQETHPQYKNHTAVIVFSEELSASETKK